MDRERTGKAQLWTVIIGAASVACGPLGFYLGRSTACPDLRLPDRAESIGLAAIGSNGTAVQQNLFAAGYTALAICLVLAAAMTLVAVARTRPAATQAPSRAATDRRRNRRIAACTTLSIQVTPTRHPTAKAALLDASAGGVALAWQGPSLPIDSRVRLNVNGYSAVWAVVVAQDGSLLRLRFADAASRGEREWLRLACLSGNAAGYGIHA